MTQPARGNSRTVTATALLSLLAGLMALPATAQERWVLVRPPLDDERLNALARDPAFLAASPDSQVAAVVAVALQRDAPLSRWQRWVEYASEEECRSWQGKLEENARQGLAELGRYIAITAEMLEAKHRVRIEGEVEVLRLRQSRCVPASRAPPRP